MKYEYRLFLQLADVVRRKFNVRGVDKSGKGVHSRGVLSAQVHCHEWTTEECCESL
jgi:hypothetical protein